MAKVLERNRKYPLTTVNHRCALCESLIQFSRDDIQYAEATFGSTALSEYCRCPVCYHIIPVPAVFK